MQVQVQVQVQVQEFHRAPRRGLKTDLAVRLERAKSQAFRVASHRASGLQWAPRLETGLRPGPDPGAGVGWMT